MSYTRLALVVLQCLVLLVVLMPVAQSYVVFRLESAESSRLPLQLEDAGEGKKYANFVLRIPVCAHNVHNFYKIRGFFGVFITLFPQESEFFSKFYRIFSKI